MTNGVSEIGNRVSAVLAAMLLSACSMVSPPPEQAPSVSAGQTGATTALGTDEVLSRLGSLAARQIAPGECGLFLWMKRDDAPLVFFQRSGGEAYMQIDGNVATLARTEAEGQFAFQFHRDQAFSAAGLTVKVSVTPEQTRSLQQGLKLPTGSISVSAPEGWSVVLPVAGAIGCQ